MDKQNHVTGNAFDDRQILVVVVDNDDETPNHVSYKDHLDLSLAHNDQLVYVRLVAHICLHICPDIELPVVVVAHICRLNYFQIKKNKLLFNQVLKLQDLDL